ncbi:cob(I)alamin adenosyltransferase [Nitratiruptor sp. YY08-26]|uniref:cob(I)yrinic acid a,c-diamide adenosyltransferase n=1 Tax=unclassified Nitratiruptor TaxID=2624044 RepID=UPI0019152448|nr:MULTISPECIES: cob(I)yrinic acid a,c-diamide adenosyltransferase [unclassified Nitratiruptor]BCD61805.1 cob(I)alamin adenosyltransferase [Nitratiruptor sp. YY08-13]BCD65740.1 cob(I)alamin adenosyltransferase [Nitratiruptor sp. YY08-26]
MIQIYTGDGKGKTTAAVGLAIRAVGARKRVLFMQFMKGMHSSEIVVMQSLGIEVDREWDGKFIIDAPSHEQKAMVQRQYIRAKEALQKSYDLIVLDEIIVAMHFKLLHEEEIIELMKIAQCELVLTGRGATKKLIETADLVTEMKKIKHYFDAGVAAREGFEF